MGLSTFVGNHVMRGTVFICVLKKYSIPQVSKMFAFVTYGTNCSVYLTISSYPAMYKRSQEERTTLWKAILSAILSKKKKKEVVYMCTRVLFRTVSEIELFHRTLPKLLIRKRYYVLFLIPVFIVQVTKLVQFTQYNTFSRIPPSASMHFATHVRICTVYSVLYSKIAASRKPF
jgi:hypothetical protein